MEVRELLWKEEMIIPGIHHVAERPLSTYHLPKRHTKAANNELSVLQSDFKW